MSGWLPEKNPLHPSGNRTRPSSKRQSPSGNHRCPPNARSSPRRLPEFMEPIGPAAEAETEAGPTAEEALLKPLEGAEELPSLTGDLDQFSVLPDETAQAEQERPVPEAPEDQGATAVEEIGPEAPFPAAESDLSSLEPGVTHSDLPDIGDLDELNLPEEESRPRLPPGPSAPNRAPPPGPSRRAGVRPAGLPVPCVSGRSEPQRPSGPARVRLRQVPPLRPCRSATSSSPTHSSTGCAEPSGSSPAT